MDVNALRTWGIAVSGALIAACLALSFSAPGPRAQAQPALERADATGFRVRFQGGGPIARAQAMAANGEAVRAQRIIEAQLRRQTAFEGLCFDRFTESGEIVLRACALSADDERAAFEREWLERLRAMDAVASVETDVAASAT